MAKVKMICPFSKGLCVECAQFRGRHYYMCFCSRYRGHLGHSEESATQALDDRAKRRKFEVSRVIPNSPTWLVLNDFMERRQE